MTDTDRPFAASLPGRLAQLAAYAAFAAFIGYFSSAPRYHPLEADQALLRLSFSQPGKPVADCRERTAQELAKLAPTMRATLECPRERSPIRVRIELDDRVVLDERFAPAGLRRDGAASAYRRIPVTAGSHSLRVAVSDDVRAEGFTHQRQAQLELAPGRVVLIDFAADRGGVRFE